jgi:hypothetical protein
VTEPFELDPYLDALREDLPSPQDEARMRGKLAAAGLGLTVSLASKSAIAGSLAASKVGFVSALSARFATLPLLAQMGLVAATTATVATVPVVLSTGYRENATVQLTHPGIEPHRVRSSPVSGKIAPTRAASSVALSPAEDSAIAPEGSSADAKTITAVVRKKSVAEPQPPVEASTLADETALIDAALFAIRERQFARASQLLANHSRQFPNGRLSLERQRAQEKLETAMSANEHR